MTTLITTLKELEAKATGNKLLVLDRHLLPQIIAMLENSEEMKAQLNLFKSIAETMPPTQLGGWNWPQLAKQAETILSAHEALTKEEAR